MVSPSKQLAVPHSKCLFFKDLTKGIYEMAAEGTKKKQVLRPNGSVKGAVIIMQGQVQERMGGGNEEMTEHFR